MAIFSIPLILLSIPFDPATSQAITASVGQPYHGRLVNGVPFPREFTGYELRESERTYTTPEVVGAMLDAIDVVQRRFPGSQNLYFGDFSLPDGGPMGGHRSHQNGRDVDVGMYAKGNRTLDRFQPMNEENLDVPRTWAFLEGLLASQRVQYIFVDRRIQELLYDHARSSGISTEYLDRLFGNNRGAVIQHVRNHSDHIHIRFYTPWSTMAARVGEIDAQKRAVIEMAQQSYLPKKVFYYANGNEKNLDALARSFGVLRSDLCRWNGLRGTEVLIPGKPLVFYKRGFEFEPVQLAQSLQPDSVPESPNYRYAALRSASPTLSDAGSASRERSPSRREKSPGDPVTFTTKAKRGDTIEKIARRNGLDAVTLARANGVKTGAALKPGLTIKLVGMKPPAGAGSCEVVGSGKSGKSPSKAVSAGVNSKPAPAGVAVRTANAVKEAPRTSGAPVDKIASVSRNPYPAGKGGQAVAGAKSDAGKPAANLSEKAKGSAATVAKVSPASVSVKNSQQSAAKAASSARPEKTVSAKPAATGTKAIEEARKSSPAGPASAAKAAVAAGIAKNPKTVEKR